MMCALQVYSVQLSMKTCNFSRQRPTVFRGASFCKNDTFRELALEWCILQLNEKQLWRLVKSPASTGQPRDRQLHFGQRFRSRMRT